VFSTRNNSSPRHNSDVGNDRVADARASFGFQASRCHTLGSALSGTDMSRRVDHFRSRRGSAINFPQRVGAAHLCRYSRALGKAAIDVCQRPSQGISEITTPPPWRRSNSKCVSLAFEPVTHGGPRRQAPGLSGLISTVTQRSNSSSHRSSSIGIKIERILSPSRLVVDFAFNHMAAFQAFVGSEFWK
jgi:hypothetical protein